MDQQCREAGHKEVLAEKRGQLWGGTSCKEEQAARKAQLCREAGCEEGPAVKRDQS